MNRIEKYELIEEIGRGGMGIVYKALHPFLNKYVAIKVLPEHFVFEKEFVERFTNEAKIIMNLKHQNIVRLYDAGIYKNNYYIVMDYIEGKTLKEILKNENKLPIDYSIEIMIQICKALSYAHSMGVVHRDIKPSNIIIENKTKQPHICDFGIAKAAYGTRLTLTGISIGTPEYMSPEQCKGEPVDHRTDIYSLGIVFYEILTGKVPFEGDTPIGVAYKHVNLVPAKPRIFNPEISPYLEKIILKMIAKDPDERYSNMDEIIEDLILFREGKYEKLKANEFEINKCTLTINTNPKNAKVYINGDFIGITPIENLEINYGEYKFLFVSPNYKDYSVTINIKEKAKNIFIDFEKETTTFSERETIPIEKLEESKIIENEESLPLSEKQTIPVKKIDEIIQTEEKTIPIERRLITKKKFNKSLIYLSIIFLSIVLILVFGKNIFIKKPIEEPKEKVGYLIIKIDPENAEVLIDGGKIENLTDKKEIKEGIHTIEIKAEGYKTLTDSFEIISGETKTLDYKLEKISNKIILNIDSVPKDAKVYINDKEMGNTPINEKIDPGKYTIKISKPGFEDYIENLDLKQDVGDKFIIAYLKPIPPKPPGEETIQKPQTVKTGKIKITSDPPFSKIYIDEKYKGQTPLTIELPLGKYNIMLKHEGYVDYKSTINVIEGKTQTFEIKLTPVTFIAVLNIYTIPSNADVYINDIYIGKSPILNYSVTNSDITVTIKKENYMTYKNIYHLENGEERSLVIELVPLK